MGDYYEELEEERQRQPSSWPGPEDEWPDHCTPDIEYSMTYEQRKIAAENLGPNWACILAGIGDQ